MDLVAVPERVALDAPPGVGVIGAGQPGSAGRETFYLCLPPLDHLPPVLVNGAVFAEGDVQTISNDPRVKAVYLGEQDHG